MTSRRATAGEGRSIPPSREGQHWWRLLVGRLRVLDPDERLALAGCTVIVVSLLLPWYGVTIAGGLVKTGLSSFGFAQLALLLTVASALLLIERSSRGEPLPRPLREGTLLIAAGAWAAILIGFRIADRPDLGLGPVGLRYGVFVALAGAAMIVIAGARRRRAGR